MAKRFRLKEIIGFETIKFRAIPLGKRGGDKIEPRISDFSSGHKFLDELTLWKTALRIEKYGTDQDE
jgi:hypothetical protein